MSTTFQTAVKTNVSPEQRREAIRTLAGDDDRTNLAVLVRTDGLRGEFRRQALKGLADCNASELLQELAEDDSLEDALQREAERLA